MDIIVNRINGIWNEFLLMNDHGMQVGIMDYGGIVTKMLVPDKYGCSENVVLGYENYQAYEQNPFYFGALIGRVAGRIANSQFTIDGQTYQLKANEGTNHLHSANHGFHQAIWQAEPFQTQDQAGVRLQHTSPAGEGGYPGTVSIQVTYTLDNTNQLTIDYDAVTDQTTPLALTNHTYFNLSGNLRDTVARHHVQMAASHFAELDKEMIPTGKWLNVFGTPFDFLNGRFLEDGLLSNHPQVKLVGCGYDHYFLFDVDGNENEIIVTEPISGRKLTLTTTQPGVVLYSGNGLESGVPLRNGISQKHLGLCLETQAHPAALNHTNFPGILLTPEKKYQQQTVYQFGLRYV